MNRFDFFDFAWRWQAPGRRMFVVGACLMAALAAHGRASAVPLTDLLAGSSITVGDCLFTDWQLLSSDATGTAPNLSLVSVNPLANDLGNPGIQIVGNNQLAISGFNALDLVLKYRVQVLPAGNTFEGHSLTITGLSFGSGSGVGFVSNGLVTGPGENLESAVAIGDPANGVFQFADAAAFSPQSGIFVTTNIFLQGFSSSDTINLTTFNQRFLQTGPPVLEGDYNQDGVVDAADYTVWRNHLGAPAGTLPNDTSGAAIGLVQYNSWKANYGNTGGSGSASFVANATAVPEPSTFLLATLCSGIATILRQRRGLLCCFVR
jgi:hypothetical protein